MGRVRNAFLLCGALVWFSPAASASQFFYAFSGSSLNTLTAIDIGTGFAVSTIAVTGGYSDLTGSAFDPSGAFYATGKDSTANPVVIRVNLTTGVGTLLGSLHGLFSWAWKLPVMAPNFSVQAAPLVASCTGYRRTTPASWT
jgi:hypothetical protein